MDFHWTTWLVSVAAVVASGAVAWLQGNLTKRPGLDMGFASHGGMWGDLLLLPIANAAIVPHLQPGIWIVVALAVTTALSVWVHVHWYRGPGPQSLVFGPRSRIHSCEHMWPSRPHGSWWKDLSWAGWAHLVYVAGELAVLIGFLLFPMPDEVVAVVCIVFTIHVPLGLLQPRWYLTGKLVSPRRQPLLVPLLATLWVIGLVKL